MLEDDPFAPPPKKPLSLEAQLEGASIEDLKERIKRLENEIALCERAIATKAAQRAAAESVFGGRPS
jgi:uncharacterized small protein (DUF1192 family)